MARSIEEFLAQDERKDLLRFLTAGSVDDGKSTLIGRLLCTTASGSTRTSSTPSSATASAAATPATISTTPCCATA